MVGSGLYDRTTAPLNLQVRTRKTEVIKTLLYGCVTWTLRAKHFANLRTAHHQVLLRVIGFHRRLRTDHTTLSALTTTSCESIETTIRKRRLFFAGNVARQSKERLPSRVMFGTIAGEENPRPGGQFKTWHRCILKDIREFRATEGSTEVAPFWCLELRPLCCPLQPKGRGIGTGGSLKQPNG